MRPLTTRVSLWQTTDAGPWRYGDHVVDERRRFLVAVSDAEGRTGWGEAAPLPGFGEPPEEIAAALSAAARPLAGVGIPAHPMMLAGAIDARLPSLPAAARGAIECALAGLAAAARGCSLARWLHPDAAPTVVANAMLGTADRELSVPPGVLAVKVKLLPGDWDAQLARLQALRAAHPTLPLRLDANAAWDRATLAERAEALAALDVELLEQPLPADDLDGLIEGGRRLGLPLAADESVLAQPARLRTTTHRGRGSRRMPGADTPRLAVVLKPGALGLDAAWTLASELVGRDHPVVVTHMLEGPVGRAAAAELACAVAGLWPDAHPERDRPHGVMPDPPIAGRLTPAAVEPDLDDWRPI